MNCFGGNVKLTVMRGSARISAGVALLGMVLVGCGGTDGTDDAVQPAAGTPSAASPSAQPALTLVDDEASADAGKKILVAPLTNDSVTRADGTDAALLDTYEPAELALTVEAEPAHGTRRHPPS